MLKNHLRIALRNLRKNTFYSFLTIFGLAIGLAAGFLILQYVYYELTYDQHFENKDNIYRVQQDRYNDGELSTQWAAGCAGVGYAMKEDFPEVLDFVNLTRSSAEISYERNYFKPEYAFYAGKNFFEVFSVPLLTGIDSMVLRDPFGLVLSESFAKKIFGNEDPVGKELIQNDNTKFTVTGVFQDLPEKSHMKFDLLYSFEAYVNFTGEESRTAWQWDGFLNYIVLRDGTDPSILAAKLPAFVEQRAGEELQQYNAGMEFNLQPLTKIHLISDYRMEIKPTGDERATYFLLAIGLFVLFIAWINYINLTTAQSLKRAREVGIRKVLGSLRRELISQFLLESLLMNLLGLFVAFILLIISFPLFNTFIGRPVSFTLPEAPWFWVGISVFFLIGTLLSGFYPAVVLSRFKPIRVLKGKFTSGSEGNFLRKSLVTVQFIASIFLISGTYVVYKQLSFLKSQDLGLAIEQTLNLKSPAYSSDSILNTKFDVFKNALLNESNVKSLAASTAVPGRTPEWNAGGIRLLSQTERETNQYRILGCDDEFMDFYGLDLVTGRKFDKNRGTEEQNVIFNEAAVHRIGFSDPEDIINQRIFFWGDTFSVVGVVKNYRQESPKQAYDALIFRYFPYVSGFYSVKMETNNMTAALQRVEVLWQQAFQNKPFEYFFLDDYYQEQYKSEMNFMTIFGLFAILAIIVACLGLFGMASYVTQLRSKEVGVRKVLGASVQNLWALLTFDFIKWIGLAIVLALPITWYILSGWLENFATRINMNLWVFILPATLLVLIATATVSFYTIKSAYQNPANTLQDE